MAISTAEASTLTLEWARRCTVDCLVIQFDRAASQEGADSTYGKPCRAPELSKIRESIRSNVHLFLAAINIFFNHLLILPLRVRV